MIRATWQDAAAGVYLYRAEAGQVAGQLDGVAAVVTDPPYGLAPGKAARGGFMGHAWDRDVPAEGLWADLLQCCRPGAPLFAFGACRTYHRLATRVEDAGWQICDQLQWLNGNGFPKGLAVDKLLDRQRDDTDLVRRVTAGIRLCRDRRGLKNSQIDQHFGTNGMAGHWTTAGSQPAVPRPEQWAELRRLIDAPRWLDGLVGQANARKNQPGDQWDDRPVIGTRNHGTGKWSTGGRPSSFRSESADTLPASAVSGMWHGWRAGLQTLKPCAEPICYAQRPPAGTWAENAKQHGVAGLWIDGGRLPGPAGRHPANVVHDGSPEVLQAFGNRPPAESPARFFYCAKASKREKTAAGRVDNPHDTVKPLALMRWLIRLTWQAGLERGGVVLDPFAGSGTTAVAAVAEGRPVIAIERDAKYFRTMRDRVRLALQDRRAAEQKAG